MKRLLIQDTNVPERKRDAKQCHKVGQKLSKALVGGTTDDLTQLQ